MKLSVCIASRGHPRDLLSVIKSIDDRVADTANTTISVALDRDDGSNPDVPATRCRLDWSIADREDSLGAKYNRAQKVSPPDTDFYVLGADDNLFDTEGWDNVIRTYAEKYNGEFGLVYFGRLDGALPTQMAIPRQLVETQGFLFPPFWPFWFHDTWTDEIGHLTGRILWAPVNIKEIGGRGKTRGLRDVIFWTKFFELLRPMRESIAAEISQKYNAPWLHAVLQQKVLLLRQYFTSRNQGLLDPATAVSFERRMSVDAEPSERYARIKKSAEEMIAAVTQEKAA